MSLSFLTDEIRFRILSALTTYFKDDIEQVDNIFVIQVQLGFKDSDNAALCGDCSVNSFYFFRSQTKANVTVVPDVGMGGVLSVKRLPENAKNHF